VNDTLVAAQTVANIAANVFKEGEYIDGFRIVHMSDPAKFLEFDQDVYMLSGEAGEVIKQNILMTYDMANAMDIRLVDGYIQPMLEGFVESFVEKITRDADTLLERFIQEEGNVKTDGILCVREPMTVFEDTNLHRRRKKGFYAWMEIGLGVHRMQEEIVIPTETCKECKGSGKYVGFTVIDDCKECGGSGVVAVATPC